MRLKPQHLESIRAIVRQEAGEGAAVCLFGSRVDDTARGGDIDLLALLAARIAGRISRALDDRKVDVVLAAPNLLNLPIHEVAREEGIWL